LAWLSWVWVNLFTLGSNPYALSSSSSSSSTWSKRGFRGTVSISGEILLEPPGADIGIVQGGKWEAHTPLGAEYSEYPLWVP